MSSIRDFNGSQKLADINSPDFQANSERKFDRFRRDSREEIPFDWDFTEVLEKEDVDEIQRKTSQDYLKDSSRGTISPVVNLSRSPGDQTENGGRTVQGEEDTKTEESIEITKFTIQTPKAEIMQSWSIHSKKIEAFCTEWKSTLCIDCILSNNMIVRDSNSSTQKASLWGDKNKQHVFMSLESAVAQEKDVLASNLEKISATRKTLKKLELRIDKFVKEIEERVKSNEVAMEEVYELVVQTITKKRDDWMKNMNEIREKEFKNASERKQKIESHVQSIDVFMLMKDNIDDLSDLEILKIAKESEETIKMATKNIVNNTFSLSILPELKKDIEISNFGKQLKNALRDQEIPKSQKCKKPLK
jgi:hypothetical protein